MASAHSSTQPVTASSHVLHARLPELLAFRAPYLVEKLIHLGIVDDVDEGALLFQEVKKYLVLADMCGSHRLPMFSVRIDEVWHQFVLFTAEYHQFCARFAGRYLHHGPEEAPRPERDPDQPPLTFPQFRALYETHFGELSPLWLDQLSLTPKTRVQRSPLVSALALSVDGDAVVLASVGDARQPICRVDRRAEAALRFIAEHPMFLLRELPGLSDADRIALCRPLVEFHVLKLAP